MSHISLAYETKHQLSTYAAYLVMFKLFFNNTQEFLHDTR